MNLPILYKKTSTGAIQQWEIYVTQKVDLGSGALIVTTYGQVDGKMQTTTDAVFEGKNAGKANATTPLQQAEAEALAKWQKQKKKGYVETIDGAQADEVDELIEGGIVPMLAKSFEEHGNKIKYPCLAQPKYDGHRCIAIINNGKCTLWSRTRKPINSAPHIVQELEMLFPKEGKVIFDGELYNHDYKNNFEALTSAIRKDEPAENHKIIQYHIYDTVTDSPCDERMVMMQLLIGNENLYVKVTPTLIVESESSVLTIFDLFRNKGYEGIMLRNAEGLYVNKRSNDLQKVKEFEDAEFDIVGVDEGRGRLAGSVGSFICRDNEGREFNAKMSGDTEALKTYFQDHSLWQGKKLTVQYQGLTSAGIPRFPVGLRIREDI